MLRPICPYAEGQGFHCKENGIMLHGIVPSVEKLPLGQYGNKQSRHMAKLMDILFLISGWIIEIRTAIKSIMVAIEHKQTKKNNKRTKIRVSVL